MANVFSKAADAVGDVVGGFTNALGLGRGMKTSGSDRDGIIAKLLAGQKADQEAKDAQAGQLAQAAQAAPTVAQPTMKKGGMVKRANNGMVKKASGGMTKSSASSRADGMATKGKTRGKLC